MLAYTTSDYYTKLFTTGPTGPNLLDVKIIDCTINGFILLSDDYILLASKNTIEIQSITGNYTKQIDIECNDIIYVTFYNLNIFMIIDNAIKIFDINLTLIHDIKIENYSIDNVVVINENKILIKYNTQNHSVYDLNLKRLTTNIDIEDDYYYLLSSYNKIIIMGGNMMNQIKTINFLNDEVYEIKTKKLEFEENSRFISCYISKYLEKDSIFFNLKTYLRDYYARDYCERDSNIFEIYDVETLLPLKEIIIGLPATFIYPLIYSVSIYNTIYFNVENYIYKYDINNSKLEIVKIEENNILFLDCKEKSNEVNLW